MNVGQVRTTDVLSKLLDPVGRMTPTEFARRVVDLRADPDVQARVDELADKCDEDELTPEERAEHDAYIDAIDVVSILQAKARGVLASGA